MTQKEISVPVNIALYSNPSGQDVPQGSYSAREKFRYCPRKFQLSYTQGWKQKEQRASTWFGKTLEAAIQSYEENGRQRGTGPGLFEERWEKVKCVKEFDRLIEKENISRHRI